jgi:sulfotransferase family protein/glycosyl transferase family 4
VNDIDTLLPMPVVVGVGRSGTTLLRLMLDAHPELSVPAETGFLLPVFEAIRAHEEIDAAGFADLVTSFPTWPDLALEAADFTAAVLHLDPFSVTAGTREFYRLYAAARGKSRWGDKTPTYGQLVPEVLDVLPEAHFVHIVRDGRDVALSFRKTWFSPTRDVAGLARHWADQIRTTREQAAGRACYTEVRYEDLLAAPADTLRRICAAIDLDYDPAMLDYHRTAAVRLGELRDRVLPDGVTVISQQDRLDNHRFTSRPPDRARAGRWRGEMTRAEQGAFATQAGELLSELGYDSAPVAPPMLAPVSVRRVLITNCWLRTRAGTELYVRDLSLALLNRGYEPTVFSPLLGEVADEIRASGVVVTDDLSTLTDEPDVLHCQHQSETIAALSRFPGRPGLLVQHGVSPWLDETPVHPRLLRHVAVDQPCLDRILAAGVPAARATIIANGVDTARFLPRDPLPPRPRRAVVFSNYAGEHNYLPVLREACARMGIEMDVIGADAGSPAARPEELLPGYDLVFAKARAAVEAIAVGCAVVVMDAQGLAGMATYADLPEWRRWNLGRMLLTTPNDVDAICAAVDRYDPDDAARCRDLVREHWSLDLMVDALVAEYDAVHAAWDPADADDRAELRALAAPLSRLGPLRAELETTRAERDEALPYVEQTPRLVEAWQHEQEQARLLRQHIENLQADQARQ